MPRGKPGKVVIKEAIEKAVKRHYRQRGLHRCEWCFKSYRPRNAAYVPAGLKERFCSKACVDHTPVPSNTLKLRKRRMFDGQALLAQRLAVSGAVVADQTETRACN
jgi:hypothetical protein